ncbi:MAG: aminotransferase class V-fold PLP-dependent enzyme [Clostridiales bacterium]|nr:aminotransferase class V-fold PLP-dependent enzyme [Clostridiales bacterium]
MQYVYLDNAATTFPKPPGVSFAMKNCIDGWCGNPGRGAHPLSQKSAEAVFGVREQIAEMFGSKSPENVVFTSNATGALNIAIKSLVPQGHVLLSDIEHNAVVRPVFASGLRYSIFSALAETDELLYDLSAHLSQDTKAVIASAGSNICGASLPLSEIGKLCREHGIFFIVDASQYAGTHDIDIEKMNIDALCAPGHKSLYGPQGSGFVLFSDEAVKAAEKGPTLIEGGNGVNSREMLMPPFTPERFEAGTLSVPNIVGLGEGLKFVKKEGPSKIFTRESALYEYTRNEFSQMYGLTMYAGQIRRSSILLFNIDRMKSEETAAALAERGICVRSGLHCAPLAHAALGTPEHGAVRISFGAFNTYDDVYYLVQAVKELL